ncbi:hypothetical protein ACHAXM_004948 [Skeletonema potamos]
MLFSFCLISAFVMSSVAESEDDWHVKFYHHAMLSSTVGDNTILELPSFLELHSATRHYREMADGITKQLSMSHEVALRTEEIFFPHSHSTQSLSHQLERKISKTAELLEHNAFVLEEILKPFPVNSIESSTSNLVCQLGIETIPGLIPSADESSSVVQHSLARYIPSFGAKKANSDNVNEEQPYEEAVQIIAHLTRDWSKDGAHLRDEFGWIKEQLWKYHYEKIPNTESILSPILVPGAGIGRLAFDLAFAQDEERASYPFAVEAMDNSIVMAAAAHHLFHIHNNGKVTDDNMTSNHEQTKIYPFVSDSLTNEVDTQWRWDSTEIPEQSVLEQLQTMYAQQPHQRPQLSYTIGDFVTTYSSPSKQGQYGSLVSLFFIDTATNIYEYILTIRHLLRSGGVWINLGPVQWHRNSQLHPTTNELRDMIQAAGFEVRHWEVSEKLVAYRHPDDLDSTHSKERGSRSTRSEAYRPLKFVAVLNSDESSADAKEGCLLLSIQKVRLLTGRRSIMNMHFDSVDEPNG